MKQFFKKCMSVFVAGAMLAVALLGFASCGKEEGFFIGASGPLTGDAASYGIAVQRGAELAVKQLNAKGGVKFRFEIKDDAAEAGKAGTNYDLLFDAGMQASLSGVTSGAAEAFVDKAGKDKLFCLSPSASADPVINKNAYSFRLCFGDPDQGKLAAQWIHENMPGAKVGAIYNTSDSYSSGIYAAFQTEMATLGITYTEKTFDNENKTDFSSQAEALKDCDVIFMPFYYTEASLFAKAATQKGCDATYFGCDGFDGISPLISDVMQSNRVMYITPFDVESQDATTKAFVEAFRAEYNADPDQFAADAYDAMMVIADAIAKAGITDYTVKPETLSEAIINVITASNYSYTGLTGTMKWEKSGACVKAPVIKVLSNPAQ